MEQTTKPNLVEEEVIVGRTTYFINLNVEFQDGWYIYDQIKIEYDKWNYSGIVDALIQYKYPIDKMQAVINNYLLEPENLEYVTVFNEMQAWRKEAKEIAKQALEYGVS
jgi:hypothetical protein